MDKLKEHLSSDIAIVIYMYILTMIAAILSYLVTINNINLQSNNATFNYVVSLVKDGGVVFSWIAVALLLIISIIATIKWIKKDK